MERDWQEVSKVNISNDLNLSDRHETFMILIFIIDKGGQNVNTFAFMIKYSLNEMTGQDFWYNRWYLNEAAIYITVAVI